MRESDRGRDEPRLNQRRRDEGPVRLSTTVEEAVADAVHDSSEVEEGAEARPGLPDLEHASGHLQPTARRRMIDRG